MSLPPDVTKEDEITVTFTATDEGMLTATAECKGEKKSYTLENRIQMSPEEIEKSQAIMERLVREA